MSVAAPAPTPEEPDLVAPVWHTGLVLLYVVLPLNWLLRPVWRITAYTRTAFHIYLIAFYMAGVVLVYLGMSLHRRRLEELIGSLWTGWRSALRDVGIAIGFWLVARFASRLIHYLVPSYTAPRSILHSKAALLISIFAAIAAGVAEELIFRGYLQKQFTALCGNAGAGMLIQAILFALFHGYTQVLPTFVQHFFFGLMAGVLVYWRKSLLPGMIGHAWLDAYWDVLRIVGLG